MAIIPNDEKVFMVSNTTNTTYSGSQALKDMNEWYTMEDVKNTVLPYKVYTALLTQSGGDDPNGDNGGTAVGNYPELVIGRTYYIVDNFQLECDFTNVGAPNNNVGTYFVATGTTPASWGTYGELRYNTGAPVVTVLENTIGNIWFTYEGTGGYHINSDGLFVDGKTFVIIGDSYDGGANGAIIASYYQNLDIIIISSVAIDFSSSAIVGLDGLLFKTTIEIRVYN